MKNMLDPAGGLTDQVHDLAAERGKRSHTAQHDQHQDDRFFAVVIAASIKNQVPECED